MLHQAMPPYGTFGTSVTLGKRETIINTPLHHMVIYKTLLFNRWAAMFSQQTCIIIDVTMLSKALKTETDQLEKRPTPYPLPTQEQARWHCLHASRDTLGVSLDHPDK